jgi:hypothetical protein
MMEELEAVLVDARALLARLDNDFSWSSSEDSKAALSELDALIAEVRCGRLPKALEVVFAPTGPMQEVSLSSGWGQEFVDLANRYYTAVAAAIRGRAGRAH